MVTSTGYKEQFYAKATEIAEAAAKLTDDSATKSPGGEEWCAREVLTHLMGDASETYQRGMQRFVQEDTPELPLTPGQTNAADWAGLPLQKLATDVVGQYRAIGDWAATLTDDQLARPARVAFLKDTPLTETPSLQTWLGVTLSYHLPQHIEQLQKLCQ
jgi:hypothetical protein